MDTLARVGGGVLMLAGLLHFLAFRIVEWNSLTAQLLPIGLLYMGLGLLVVLGRSGACWFACIASGLGLIAAVQVMPTPLVPSSLMWTYVWLDVFVIGCLVVSIQHSLQRV